MDIIFCQKGYLRSPWISKTKSGHRADFIFFMWLNIRENRLEKWAWIFCVCELLKSWWFRKESGRIHLGCTKPVGKILGYFPYPPVGMVVYPTILHLLPGRVLYIPAGAPRISESSTVLSLCPYERFPISERQSPWLGDTKSPWSSTVFSPHLWGGVKGAPTWMPRWKLGSLVSKWVISYNLLINGVYWSYNPLIPTFDPNFQPDILVTAHPLNKGNQETTIEFQGLPYNHQNGSLFHDGSMNLRSSKKTRKPVGVSGKPNFSKPCEQWKKGPWLERFDIEDYVTTQVYEDYNKLL